MDRQRIVRVAACKAMGVIGIVLLGHAAFSEPPAQKSVPTPDRVGFPKDYQARFKVLGVIVNEKELKVNTVYGNEQAATVTSRDQLPYPEGSILLMEFRDALRDANNQVVRDANGTLKKGAVEHIDVMKRGQGFGKPTARTARESGNMRAIGWTVAIRRRPRSQFNAPRAISKRGQKTISCFACAPRRLACR